MNAHVKGTYTGLLDIHIMMHDHSVHNTQLDFGLLEGNLMYKEWANSPYHLLKCIEYSKKIYATSPCVGGNHHYTNIDHITWKSTI